MLYAGIVTGCVYRKWHVVVKRHENKQKKNIYFREKRTHKRLSSYKMMVSADIW